MGAEWTRREEEKEEDRPSMRGKGKERGLWRRKAFVGLRLEKKKSRKRDSFECCEETFEIVEEETFEKHENRKLPLAFPPTDHVVTDVMMTTPRGVD